MSRLVGIVCWALVAILVLPALVRAAQAAIPFLISLLIFLAIASLVWPSGRRRR